MRDRADFTEVEAPAPAATRIDGLTDEEWARRRLRRELVFRAAFGLAFGFVVAVLAIWHWGFFLPGMRAAAALIIAGSMVLFATLFARRRDADALDFAAWITFTEWKAIEKLPWWIIISLAAALFVLLFAFGMVLLLGRLPWFA